MQTQIQEREGKCALAYSRTHEGRSCQFWIVKRWRGILIYMRVIHAHVVELFMLFMLL